MRSTALACFLAAIACEGFAYWGLHTVAGGHAFDEMAGIIPVAAAFLGGVLAVCAVVAWWLSRRSAK